MREGTDGTMEEGNGKVNMGGFKVVCPFCDAPYDAEMLLKMETDLFGSDSAGVYKIDLVSTVDITCSKCGKLVYRKVYRREDINWDGVKI